MQDHILTNGFCVPDIGYGNPYNFTGISCFSTFLKLKPMPNTTPLSTFTRRLKFTIIDSVYPLLVLPSILRGGYASFLISDADQFLQYAIIYMAIYFPIDVEDDVYHDFFTSLFNLGNNAVSVKLKDYDIVFNLHVTHYNVSYNRTTQVFIPNDSGNHITWKINPLEIESENEANVLRYCFENEIAMFNKLYICPFVTILMDEYDIVLKNDLLIFIVDDTFNQTKVYSKWEYEQRGDKIYMCLDDYEDIYRAMPRTDIKAMARQ